MVVINKSHLPWITTGVVTVIFVFITLFNKCSSDKRLDNVAAEIAKMNDTSMTRRVVNDRIVSETPVPNVTINEYRAAQPSELAAVEKIINKRDELMTTMFLKIIHEMQSGKAPVVKDSTGKLTINFEDSCQKITTEVPVTGDATVSYQMKPQTYTLGVVMRREKLFKPKQPVAVGSLTSGCGEISSQKVVLINTEKKKVHQTTAFKVGAVIAVWEGLKLTLKSLFK